MKKRDLPSLTTKFGNSPVIITVITVITVVALIFTDALKANPSGANVVHGSVSFNGLGSSGLTINQSSNVAIINWQNFSIGAGEFTRFVQPGRSSLAINRVVSGNPTAIYGQLSANGGVMVINPNGIMVGPSGVIDVAGALTLSTLDASNADLLSGGATRFTGSGFTGVTNMGRISGEDITIMGGHINNMGSINALRAVNLGAGNDILLTQTLDGASISVLGGTPGGLTGIDNSGDIAGANVNLAAHGNSYAMAINNQGTGNIRATGYNYSGGKLTLRAGSSGGIINTGNLFARRGADGGEIDISGGDVNVSAGMIDASGPADGGSIKVSGENVSVGPDALMIADGGVDGGSIEIEGQTNSTIAGTVSAKGSIIGTGGMVTATADEVVLTETSRIDVSGGSGGEVKIGGGFQGEDSSIVNAIKTTVDEGSLVIADGEMGDAGKVIVWADKDTMFSGEISAQAKGQVGNGGFIEVSGKQNLKFRGFASTLAANGETGVLLLDPRDFLIAESAAADMTLTTLVGAAHDSLGWDPLVHNSATGLIHSNNVIIETNGTGGTGVITIGAAGGSNDDIHYDSGFDLTFLAHDDIVVNSNILNHALAGGGNINLIAGWDGTVPTVSSVDINDALSMSWGGDGGNVLINGQGLQEVSVGSRSGETNVLGDNVLISAGNGDFEYAQIGYRNHRLLSETGVHSSGAINVHAKQSIALLTNANGDPRNAHAMIGHGGSNDGDFNWGGGHGHKAAGRGTMAGDITVNAGTALVMRGSDDRSFTQIGHGGVGENFNEGATGDGDSYGAANGSIEGDKSGSITVEAGSIYMKANDRSVGGGLGRDGSNRAGARIGHGGFDRAGGVLTGDISVVSQTSIIGEGSNNTDGNWGSMLQIGHGGMRSGAITGTENATRADNGDGNIMAFIDSPGHSGAISVSALSGNIHFTASDRDNAPAMIGHGGTRSHGNHSGSVMVSATGDIIMDRYVHDGVDNSGTDRTTTNFNAAYVRGDDGSFVQIGHGGYQSSGRLTGDVQVDAGGNFEMYGGNNRSHAKVGHGGGLDGSWNGVPGMTAHGTLSGDVTMNVGGNLVMKSGNEEAEAFSQIGHGGREWVADHNEGHNGAVLVNVTGDILMASGNEDHVNSLGTTVYGSNNFTMIGHGGIYSKGNHRGAVTVNSGGDLTIETFGGYEGARDNAGVTRYDQVETGSLNFAQIGHGGYRSEFMNAESTNVHRHLWTGSRPDSYGTEAPITVNVGGNMMMEASKTVGDMREDQIFGGPYANGNLIVDSEVYSRRNHIAVGHGSIGEDGNNQRRNATEQFYRGNINVAVVGQLDMLGSRTAALDDASIQVGTEEYQGARQNFVQIGHYGGLYNRSSAFEGDIVVDTGLDIRIESGDAGASYAMIGHGGLEIGDGTFNLGHVGRTQMNGTIDVYSGGNITIESGQGFKNHLTDERLTWHQFAGIGHYNARNRNIESIDSHITVVANKNITMLAHDNPAGAGGHTNLASVHIGHGAGDRVSSNIDADINVTAGENFSITAGVDNVTHDGNNSTTNTAKVGHGDRYSEGWRSGRGTWSGDVEVKAGFNVSSTGGMIGHRSESGQHNDVTSRGDTFIAASRVSPDFKEGTNFSITTQSNATYHTVFSSGGLGTTGDLRIYVPNRPQNLMDTETVLNGAAYVGTPTGIADTLSYVGEPFTLLSRRGDENLDFIEHTLTATTSPLLGQGMVEGIFTPEGGYPLINGLGDFYQLYYNHYCPPPPPPLPPVVVPPAPTPVPFNFAPFVFAYQWEAFDQPDIMLNYDGYNDGDWGNLSLGDAFDGLVVVPRSGVEEFLDARLGSRRWVVGGPGLGSGSVVDGLSLSPADAALEAMEERDRVLTRAMRPIGKSNNVFYLYEPGAGYYSSLRLFGVPAAYVPTFAPGQ